MNCILKGNVERIALPDVFTFVNMLRKNGELVFTDDTRRRTVFIENGEIVFASSNDPDDSLGAFLVRSGLISYSDNKKTSKLITKGKRQGKILVDSFPDKEFTGKVTYISPEAEFTPKNIQTKEERVKLVFGVKIEVENPDQELKPGMPADAIIEAER